MRPPVTAADREARGASATEPPVRRLRGLRTRARPRRRPLRALTRASRPAAHGRDVHTGARPRPGPAHGSPSPRPDGRRAARPPPTLPSLDGRSARGARRRRSTHVGSNHGHPRFEPTSPVPRLSAPRPDGRLTPRPAPSLPSRGGRSARGAHRRRTTHVGSNHGHPRFEPTPTVPRHATSRRDRVVSAAAAPRPAARIAPRRARARCPQRGATVTDAHGAAPLPATKRPVTPRRMPPGAAPSGWSVRRPARPASPRTRPARRRDRRRARGR